jgi:uncharacterized membrane protein
LVGEILDGASSAPVLVAGTRATLLLGDRLGAATGINGAGEATGFFLDGTHGSYTWSAGQLTEIPLLPGAVAMQAQAINAGGVVVGFTNSVGFRWDGSTLSVLPGLVGPLAAQDINDRGWIVGSSTSADGNPHAVVLIPR